MKNVSLILIHLLVVVAKLLGPGGIKGLIAENLLLKQQLLVICRPRQHAPNSLPVDRFLFGFFSLFLRPGRIVKTAVGIRPSTLLRFHDYMVRWKYRALYSPHHRGKPGPKGPSQELTTLSSDSNAGIRALAIPASRESSRKPSASRLTETWFGVFSPSITTRKMAGIALLG